MIDIVEEQEKKDLAREIGIIKDFLLFKKEYEGNDFMDTRNTIVPKYFSQKDFCSRMNTLRQQ